MARVDVVVRQRAAHVHVDFFLKPGALFDGTRGGEILILVLALGLLVELELARAATHFLIRGVAYPGLIEKRKLL